MFRARLQFSWHLTKWHACHAICTLSPLDAALTMRFAKTRNMTRLKCCACHATWRWRSPKCCACHEKCNASSENVAKVCLPHKTNFDTLWNMLKCHQVPSATPATWNEARRRLKPTKVTTFAELAIGTAIRTSQGHLRTVVDGCERLRTVAQRRANTPSTPRPPEWSGNPCYAFGKNVFSRIEYPCLGSSVSMVSAEFQVTQADAGGGPLTSHKSSMPSSDWSEVDVEFLIFLRRSSQCRKQTDSC